MATQTEVADHLDLTQSRVSILIKDGVLPPAKGRGGYDIDACRIAYIRFLRGKSVGQVTSGYSEKEDYSRLLDIEKYREKKRENDMKEKLVAPVSLLTDALQKSISIIIPILESLPLNMKRNWPEITGDQIQLVKVSISECRNIIAESKLKID
jgi:phage terminase Nu1 subunit (DNA packaging protein)